MFAALNLWFIFYLIGLIQGRFIEIAGQEEPIPRPDPTIFEHPLTESQEFFLDDITFSF